MILLAFAVALFGIIHVVPALPGIKPGLKLSMGKAFGPIYGVASLATLAFALWALRTGDRSDIYSPLSWGRHANFLLTLLAFLCLGIFLFRGSWRNRLRSPMALGVLCWGSGHLLANGDSSSVIFFGGLILAAVLHAVLVPYATSEERGGHNMLSMLFGVALYGVFAQLHGVIAGVPLIQLVK